MSEGPNVRRKANACCGYETEVGESQGEPGAQPRRGDIAICLNCGAWLVYRNSETKLARAREIYGLEPGDMERLVEMRKFIRARGPIAGRVQR